MLILQIRCYFVDLLSFPFFFSLSHFSIFFLIVKDGATPLLLLLKMDMNKLFKFYWIKENQMLIFQIRFFC